jgi:hypothetical protein
MPEEAKDQPAPPDPLTTGELISLAEAAKLSGFSHDNLKRVAQSGKLPARKIGRNWVTTLAAVEEYRKNRSLKNIPKKYQEKT